MKKEPLYLTPAAMGRLVGLSKWTIIREIEQGVIVAWRTPGGYYRIDRKEFYRYKVRRLGIVI